MIAANDLRIGNWLDFNGKMQRVGLIDLDLDDEGEELVASIEEYDTTYILRNGKIKPIPLTPEILEACGFVNDSILLFGYTYLELEADDGWNVFIKQDDRPQQGTLNVVLLQNSIYYLHQLQNLFYALTGIELQIKLPATVQTQHYDCSK
jgi:hypothetical protein